MKPAGRLSGTWGVGVLCLLGLALEGLGRCPSLLAQQAERMLAGKVVSVLDGDSLELLVDRKRVMIRLNAIDAPEWDQAWGKEAHQALSKLALGKQASVQVTGTDKNQRTLGRVEVGGVELNAEMLKQGWAWHFKRFNQDRELAQLESAARKAKRGLWAEPNPQPPWEYRDQQQALESGKSSRPEPGSTAAAYWLNLRSNVRHNSSCKYYSKSRSGRPCSKQEGKACRICGG